MERLDGVQSIDLVYPFELSSRQGDLLLLYYLKGSVLLSMVHLISTDTSNIDTILYPYKK